MATTATPGTLAPGGSFLLESPRPEDIFTPAELSDDGQKFISPILFADGHGASCDFTHALKDDPDHPLEPTKDWYWYEPKR